MGWRRVVGQLVVPFLEFLRPIPPMVWIPKGILWFSIADAQSTLIIFFLGSVFPIVLNTMTGIPGVEELLQI